MRAPEHVAEVRLDLSAGSGVDAAGLVMTKRPTDSDLAFLLWCLSIRLGRMWDTKRMDKSPWSQWTVHG